MNEDFEKFQEQIRKCRICWARFGFEPHPLVSGNEHSKIMQIGQAPSQLAEEHSKFFTDLSGKRLKYEWYEIDDDTFYNPDNFYITGIAHCFPGKNKDGNDKTPPKICYETWVKREIEKVQNEIYIIIGAKACEDVFPNEDFEDLVFKDNYLNGKLAFVILHPSPLNNRWLKKHPEFEEERLPIIRKKIKEVLGLEK